MHDHTDDPTETWLPVVGYEDLYEVSDLGRVRNAKGQIRKPASHGEKYLSLRMSKDNKGRTKLVHHLVLEAFVGPKPAGHEAAHANDVHTDNRLSNLRWATKAGNAADKVRNGGGLNLPKPRLTADQVLEIRYLCGQGDGLKAIAKKFGVATITVWDINTRRTWAHL